MNDEQDRDPGNGKLDLEQSAVPLATSKEDAIDRAARAAKMIRDGMTLMGMRHGRDNSTPTDVGEIMLPLGNPKDGNRIRIVYAWDPEAGREGKGAMRVQLRVDMSVGAAMDYTERPDPARISKPGSGPVGVVVP